MKPAALATLTIALVLQLAAASLSAQSLRDFLEDQNVFVGTGRAVIRTLDSDLIVVGFDDGDGVVDRVFTVATSGQQQAGGTVSVLFARLAAWSGGLLVLDPVQKRAYLFPVSTPSPLTVRDAPAAPSRDDLETLLRNQYTVTRYDDVGWVAARWGQLDGLRLDELQRGAEPLLRSRLRRVGATLTEPSPPAPSAGAR